MKNNKATILHSGHRKRMRQTIDRIGLVNLDDYQKLEYILTLCFPRRNTNEIAHRLLKEFGTISAVLDADVSSLCNVEGMGLSSSQILHSLPQIFYIYEQSKNIKVYCRNFADINNYLKCLYKNSEKEQVAVIFVSQNNHIKGSCFLTVGSFCEVKFDAMEITKLLIKYNAKSIIVSHNHPHGTAMPSNLDIDTNTRLVQFLTLINIPLIDNIIIGEDGMYSFKLHKLITD